MAGDDGQGASDAGGVGEFITFTSQSSTLIARRTKNGGTSIQGILFLFHLQISPNPFYHHLTCRQFQGLVESGSWDSPSFDLSVAVRWVDSGSQFPHKTSKS